MLHTSVYCKDPSELIHKEKKKILSTSFRRTIDSRKVNDWDWHRRCGWRRRRCCCCCWWEEAFGGNRGSSKSEMKQAGIIRIVRVGDEAHKEWLLSTLDKEIVARNGTRQRIRCKLHCVACMQVFAPKAVVAILFAETAFFFLISPVFDLGFQFANVVRIAARAVSLRTHFALQNRNTGFCAIHLSFFCCFDQFARHGHRYPKAIRNNSSSRHFDSIRSFLKKKRK